MTELVFIQPNFKKMIQFGQQNWQRLKIAVYETILFLRYFKLKTLNQSRLTPPFMVMMEVDYKIALLPKSFI